MAVTIQTVPDYQREPLKAAIGAALDRLGGLERFLAGKRRVLLKPNFIVPDHHDKCSTTHPDFILAVAELVLATGREVTVADSPAFGSTTMCLRVQGALAECRARGIRVLTFRRSRPLAGLDDFPPFRHLTVAAELQDFDAVINLPKLKVHQQTVFSGATKNLFGCVVGKRKPYRHFICHDDPSAFSRMILVTARAVGPVLNLGDGVQALHRDGPRRGQPFPLQRVIASDSYFEHDWVQCRLFGLDPRRTPLFAEVSEAERAAVEHACAGVLADPACAPAAGFVLAWETPIGFTFGRVAKSAWKSLKTAVLGPGALPR